MSRKERDRLQVMPALVEGRGGGGRLRQGQAAGLLGLSVRQVRRLVRRYQREGEAGLVHRSRGRPSNRRLGAELREQVLARVRECYADFGPTLAAEKLAEREGLQVSRETLRRWLIEAGLHRPRCRRVRARRWRPRRACVGELVQVDGSHHDWLEGRGPPAVLLLAIDDASSRMFLRLAPTESTATTMALLRDYIRRCGRPRAIYADKASQFRTTRRASLEEQLQGQEAQTQLQRALRELDIAYVAAHSPQAKGRVERSFGTAQDRLVKELRLAGISTLEAANQFLERVYMPLCNQRFAVAPQSSVDAHRSAAGFDLDAIFSRQEWRTVQNDYTFRCHGRRYQIARASLVAGLRGAKVLVEQRLDGQVRARFRGRYLEIAPLPAAPAQARPATRPQKPAPPPQPRPTPTKPAPDHPWRRSYKTMLEFRARR